MKAWEKKAVISTWVRDSDEYTLSKSAAICGFFWMEPGVPVVAGGVKKNSGESSSLVSNKSDDISRWFSWIQDDTGNWEMGTTSGLEGENSGSGGVEASSSELDHSDTAAETWLLDLSSFWDMDALTCNQSPNESLECGGYLGSSGSIRISVGTGFQFPIFLLSCHKSIRCFQPTRLLTITDDSHSGVAVGMRVCSTLGSITVRTRKSSFFLSGESHCDLRKNRLILVDSDKMLLDPSKKTIPRTSIELLLTLRAIITTKPMTTLIPAKLRPRAAAAANASVSIKPCGIFIQTLGGGRFESADLDRSNRHEAVRPAWIVR